MDKELVSIICPVYNAEKFLLETITSVRQQSYVHWELWLINDGSMDNSLQLIEKARAEDERIKLEDLPHNQGVAHARNVGLSKANGSYIAFIDSDDTWHTNKLEKQLNFMQKQQALLSHTAYQKVDAYGNLVAEHISVSERVNYKKLLKHNEIGLSTALIKKSALQDLKFIKIGHEDYVFWLKLLKLVKESSGLNEVLTTYRSHSGSLSHNKIVAAGYTWNIYRKIEKFTIFKAAYYFLCYSWHAGKKYLKRK